MQDVRKRTVDRIAVFPASEEPTISNELPLDRDFLRPMNKTTLMTNSLERRAGPK